MDQCACVFSHHIYDRQPAGEMSPNYCTHDSSTSRSAYYHGDTVDLRIYDLFNFLFWNTYFIYLLASFHRIYL